MKIETDRGLEDVLYEKGLISSEELSAIKFERINTGKTAEEIITDRKYVPLKELTMARGDHLGIPFVELGERSIPPEILDYVPEAIAKRHELIPFEEKSGNLSVAMADPLDLQTIEFIERKTSLRVKPHIGYAEDINSAIGEQYSKTISPEVTEALRKEGVLRADSAAGEVQDFEKAEEIIREAPVARIVSTILEFAIRSRASDIHIEPGEEKARVRYRVDGILQEKLSLPKRVHPAVTSRIKILSDLKIDEHRIPQDGRFRFVMGESQVDLRVSTLPTVFGEKVVLRLLKESSSAMELQDLGLRGIALKRIEEALRHPNGIILVTGPTGSGKTVTLASCLSKLNSVQVNIISLEDPVEIRVPGISQVQVNPAIGLTFASGLRSILRQDPDIVMVGEIRDTETAQLAVHAALTGHLVLSTVHTNSASGTVARLIDMGVEAFLLTPAINAIVAQRLVRTICEDCKEAYDPPPQALEDAKRTLGKLFPQKDKVQFHRGKGCEACDRSGYSGRIGIFEALALSDKISGMVLENQSVSDIEQQAIAEGMITLRQDGYLKVIEGVTTLEEVLRVTEE